MKLTTLKKVIALALPYWQRVLAGIVVGVTVSGITGAIAWIVKPALDNVLVERKYEFLTYIPLAVLLLFSLKGVLQYIYAYLMRSAAFKLVLQVQMRVHGHILKIPIPYFYEETSGMIISRVINDVRMLAALFTEVIQTVLVQVPTIIVLLGVAFYRKWDLTLIAITMFPFIMYSMKRYGKRVKRKSHDAQQRISDVSSVLGESAVGIKIIKVFNRGEFRQRKFIEGATRYYRSVIKVVRLKESTKLWIDVLTGMGIAMMLWYSSGLLRSGAMTSGDLVSIVAAIYLIFTPAKKIGEAYSALQEIMAAYERIEGIFERQPEASGTRKIDSFRKALRFEHVSFAYRTDTPPVLDGISIEIAAGEVVALVGPSGAGKTTFAELIPRFYDPTSGRITIDGIDIRDLDIASLRELIGIVSQDIILFNDTVAQNILFGREDATETQIIGAARLAFADEFIRELPEGYDTVVGERGLKLSGGQRQRLAIARAILKNPPILILDEATSALDTVSEALVQQALEGLMKNRTTIVIAHRLSTVKNADKIVVLERGKICEIGTHDSLLAQSELYQQLYKEMKFS